MTVRGVVREKESRLKEVLCMCDVVWSVLLYNGSILCCLGIAGMLCLRVRMYIRMCLYVHVVRGSMCVCLLVSTGVHAFMQACMPVYGM